MTALPPGECLMMSNDLFPYNQTQSETVLSEYQHLARKPSRSWFFRVVIAVFIVSLIRGYRDGGDPDYATWSMLRTADAELSVASQARDWPTWIRWLTEVESEEETLTWIVEEMEEHQAKGLLQPYGQEELVKMKAVLAKDVPVIDPEQFFYEVAQGEVYRWDLLAAEDQFGGDLPKRWSLETSHLEELACKQAFWYRFGAFMWLGVMVIGIPFVPAALRCFLPRNHVPLRPATRAWRPRRTLVMVMLADLLAGMGLSLLYLLVPYELWESFPGVTTLLTDSLWRISGPLLVLVFVTVRWRHLPRLLNLDVAPVIPPILGMLSLGVLYNFVSYHLVSLLVEPDFLLNLSADEEGWIGLVFAVVSSVILAPFVEEVVYRGVVFQSHLRRYGFLIAMIISTSLFAVVHYYDWHGTLSVAFFGIAACALYRRTGSLWAAVIYHALENGLITLGMWPVYFGAYQ